MDESGRADILRQELDRVASEIDDGLLSFASPEARHEWTSVRSRWRGPANADAIGDDDLVVVVQKVQRFSEILRTLKARGLRPAEGPGDRLGTPGADLRS